LDVGHKVILLDIYFDGTSELECTKIKGDVYDDSTFGLLSDYPDVVFHAAAVSRVEWGEIDPGKCLRTNVMGLMNTLSWLMKATTHPHFIFASSREVYGEPKSVPATEDCPKQPISVYGTSKLAAEQLLAHFGVVDKLRYTILRFSNVYGSTRDLPERVIPRFTERALRGQQLILNGGDQILDFTFIDDVVEGLMTLISQIEHGSDQVVNTDFNFCSGQGTSIKQLADLVKDATKSKSEIVVSARKSYDVTKFIGNSAKAQRILQFRTERIETGFRKYVERVLTSRMST
jgi:nucleoside-diphosphate-sugar epimerase